MKTSLSLPLGSFQNYLSEPAFYFLLLTRLFDRKAFLYRATVWNTPLDSLSLQGYGLEYSGQCRWTANFGRF
jgi:hypothetical protein